jgi:cytidylate kinase
MKMPTRIHVFGASGSGTTSLTTALAAKHDHRHFDTDEFYWFPTDPPYQHKRPPGKLTTQLNSILLNFIPEAFKPGSVRWRGETQSLNGRD